MRPVCESEGHGGLEKHLLTPAVSRGLQRKTRKTHSVLRELLNWEEKDAELKTTADEMSSGTRVETDFVH